jgi:hypothetical protein
MTRRHQKTLALGCYLIAAAAFAQQSNPLLGNWRGVVHDADNVSMPFDFSYYPDNTFAQSMAIPPNSQTGKGSGILLARGHYRLLDDHTVELTVEQRSMCPSGDMSACTPLPAGNVQIAPFRMEGPDKVVNTADGQITYRVR